MALVSTEDKWRFVERLEECSAFLPDEIRLKYSSVIAKIKEVGHSFELAIPLFMFLSTHCHKLFHPEEGWATWDQRVASLMSAISNILRLKADIPQYMQPEVDKLEADLEKLQELRNKMRNEVGELIKKVDNAVEEGLKIESKEFKKITGKQNQLDRDLLLCKTYFTAAEKSFNELESKVLGKTSFYFISAIGAFVLGGALTKAAVTAFVGATAAAGAGEVTTAAVTTGSRIWSFIKRGVPAMGAVGVGIKLLFICARYAESVDKIKAMKEKLHTLNKELEIEVNHLKQQMKLVEVEDAYEEVA